MRRQLSHLTGLRALEAAARLKSFKDAAVELHVTPAAISQQIRLIEEIAGHPLFIRHPTGLEVTPQLESSADALTAGFDLVAEAFMRLKGEKSASTLLISAPTSFAAKWLIPRLELFSHEYPGIDVEIDADDDVIDLSRLGVDFAIRFGCNLQAIEPATPLFPADFVPVCSPKVLEEGPPIRIPQDLRHHKLLHRVPTARSERRVPTWKDWLSIVGIDPLGWPGGYRLHTSSLVTEAALSGQGIALAATRLLQHEIQTGRLIRPFERIASAFPNHGYFLVQNESPRHRLAARAFRKWIMTYARWPDAPSIT